MDNFITFYIAGVSIVDMEASFTLISSFQTDITNSLYYVTTPLEISCQEFDGFKVNKEKTRNERRQEKTTKEEHVFVRA